MFGFFVCVPLLFLWSGWFRRRRVFSFLLFLSGAGETQTPFGGFGVPLVFSSSRTRSPTSDPYFCAPTPTPRPRPAPAFFSFFRRRRSFSGSRVFRLCPGGVGFIACSCECVSYKS